MKTKIVKLDPVNPDDKYIKEAARIIASGGLVIIPTETVYGIAAHNSDKTAMQRLHSLKKRPKDKPFSLHIAAIEKMHEWVIDVPVAGYKLIDKFWPGPLTLIFKSRDNGTIGIRMPDNEIALKVISFAGVDVVCPSSNLAGTPAPVDFESAIKDLNGHVDFAIDSGATKLGVESTVLDLTVEPFKVLREGAVKKESIEAVVGEKTVLFVCTGNSCRSVMAEGFLKKKMRESGRQDVNVISAGIMAAEGMRATEETIKVLAEEGFDASSHYARKVTPDMLKRADIILVMEDIHEERILGIAPEVRNRIFLLKEFARMKNNSLNIPDPIGHDMGFYKSTFAAIKEALERVVNII